MRAATLLMCFLVLAGCGKPAPYGYWEGRGKMREVPLKDNFRELTRSADYEFWFNIAKDGAVAGEIDLDYDAVLTVENLPSVSAGQVSFNPKVGGKVTDLDPTRKFPLVGFFDGSVLKLALGVPADARKTIRFVIRADPGVSAGIGPVGIDASGASGAQSDRLTIDIDMVPFSPFYGDPPVKKRPGGPFAAEYSQRSETLVVEWTAKQVNSDPRNVEITPEMQKIIDKLR